MRSPLSTPLLDALLEECFLRHPEIRRKGRAAWFLDEIQLVPGWDRFVRRVLDTEAIDIVVSGSSARMLSREIHSSLRGRALPTVITPFSFREALRHRGEEPTERVDTLLPAARSAVEKRLREYLVAGASRRRKAPASGHWSARSAFPCCRAMSIRCCFAMSSNAMR
jgi:predicted AAA+ superfamily ATPase